MLSYGHQGVCGKQAEVLGFTLIRRGNIGLLVLIFEPEQPTLLLSVCYRLAEGWNPLLGVSIPTSLSLNAVVWHLLEVIVHQAKTTSADSPS